jgi:hypothetical protein
MSSGPSGSRSLKQDEWQNHTCHFPSAVSTVKRHGSMVVARIDKPQKQHGPHSNIILLIVLPQITYESSNYTGNPVVSTIAMLRQQSFLDTATSTVSPPTAAGEKHGLV